MPRHRLSSALTLGLLVLAAGVHASDTPAPTHVVVPGSLQSELGCAGDWDPACDATALVFDSDDDVWQGTFAVPAGNWEYKAALNHSWDENYGAHAVRGGDNIHLDLAAPASVKFYYSHETHWIADSRNQVIAVARDEKVYRYFDPVVTQLARGDRLIVVRPAKELPWAPRPGTHACRIDTQRVSRPHALHRDGRRAGEIRERLRPESRRLHASALQRRRRAKRTVPREGRPDRGRDAGAGRR